MKKITIEKIELNVNTDKNKFTPIQSKEFIDHGEILKTLAIAIRDNLPTLLIGESGTGKTSAIRYLAEKTKNGLRRVNLNGGTTADELVGRLLINDKGTYWIDGILTEAMRNGEWIVLDEINAALPEVLFVLQSVMDDDGYLVLTEKDDKEIVKKHENFRIFATCNPPEYAGTKEMNKALLSRFVVCIKTEFPPERVELNIIKHHLGEEMAKTEIATKLIKLANTTRESKENEKTDYAINTRDVISILKLTKFVNPIEALKLGFSNKLETDESKALLLIAKLHLPLSSKKANEKRITLSTQEDFIIGKSYKINENVENAYECMYEYENEFKELIKKDLATIIEESQVRKENAIKNDTFRVTSTYYENTEEGSVTEERRDEGEKLASVIEITGGKNKGKRCIILHHPEIKNTMNIVEKTSIID